MQNHVNVKYLSKRWSISQWLHGEALNFMKFFSYYGSSVFLFWQMSFIIKIGMRLLWYVSSIANRGLLLWYRRRGRGRGRGAGPTNKDTLEKLKPHHPLPEIILQWRKISSALTKVKSLLDIHLLIFSVL